MSIFIKRTEVFSPAFPTADSGKYIRKISTQLWNLNSLSVNQVKVYALDSHPGKTYNMQLFWEPGFCFKQQTIPLRGWTLLVHQQLQNKNKSLTALGFHMRTWHNVILRCVKRTRVTQHYISLVNQQSAGKYQQNLAELPKLFIWCSICLHIT